MPPTTRARRRRRAAPLPPERRRPMVLDAALGVYLALGYARASMDAIADAAGVTKPVLYDCFASKQELFAALEAREERRLLDALAGSLPDAVDYEDPERAMTQGFAAFFSAVEAAPDAYRLILLEGQGQEADDPRRGDHARTQQAERIAEVIRPWLEGREAEDPARMARLLGHAVVGVGESLGRLMLAEPGVWSAEELSRTAAALFTRGSDAF